MTKPNKSVRLRRIEYSQQSPPLVPIFYDDDMDGLDGDVLDAALAYNGNVPVLGYGWSGVKQLQEDFISPDTEITFYPNDPDNQTTVAFVFGSTEPHSTFIGQLDGAGYVGIVSPKTYSGIITGSHTFDVKAVDVHGNIDATPATWTWVKE